jgi:hypothetical protein
MTEQGTIEWKLERLGHVTASRVADVLAKIKSGEAKTREDYRWELVTQRIIQEPPSDRLLYSQDSPKTSQQ